MCALLFSFTCELLALAGTNSQTGINGRPTRGLRRLYTIQQHSDKRLMTIHLTLICPYVHCIL